jgi:threonine/homoserine/homoserine lactone efflux protein
MTQVVAELLPLALIIAASPILLIPMLVLLLSPDTRAAARAFLLACAASIAAVVVTAFALSGLIQREVTTSTWSAWLRIVIGLALLSLAVRKWRGRSDDSPPPAWMARLNGASPAAGRRFGLVVCLANPKVLAVAATAGVVLAQSDLPPGARLAIGALFVVVTVGGILAAYLAAVLGGDAAAQRLVSLREWFDRHGTGVAVGVLVLLGLLLIIDGVAKLTP